MSHVHGLTIRGNPTSEHPCPTSDAATSPTLDAALALDILRRRFPTVSLWFGTSTGHWWAYANGQLIEARTPQELGHCLDLASSGEPRTTRPWAGRGF